MATAGSKKLLNTRRWLRPNTSYAPQTSVHSEIRIQEGKGYGKCKNITYRSIYGRFGLRDCNNYASLEFDANNEKHYRTQLKAIDKLVNELLSVRDAWVVGRELIEERGGWKEEGK